KRARRDLTKVREMRCAAWSEQSIEELADRLYASDAGLDRDFDGGEPTVVAWSAGSNKIREALRNLVVREPTQGPLGILEQTREICHGLHGLWIPPVVIRIKVPG